MTKEEFDAFLTHKAFYELNNFTTSSNEGVRAVYSYVLKYEQRDSDHWSEGHASSDLLQIITYYEATVWDELKKDISNWSENQIELFAQSLLTAYPEVPERYKVGERIDFILFLMEKNILYNSLYSDFRYWCQLDLSLLSKADIERLAVQLEINEIDEVYMLNDRDPFAIIKKLMS